MITIRVLPDGAEPYEVVARSRDIAQWEKGGRGRSLSKFSEAPSMVDVYSLAHTACQRQGRFDGLLSEFEESVDVEVLTRDGDADPTPPAR